MQIRDLSKPLTAKKLNESLAQRFGYKLNLEQFTDVQLEDARNKLRTKLSQFEVSEGFGSMEKNPSYQKTRAMLDCVNQAILERSEEDMDVQEDEDTAQTEAQEELSKQIKASKLKAKAEEHSVPESWIESALERIELGESDEEELAAELVTRYDLRESVANYIVYLSEGEEEKAKNIMAAKDMVERITGWLEDTAQLKAEQLLELTDSIRENQGSDVAQQFTDAVKPALEAIYTALETSRQGLQSGLSVLSGGEAPSMGAPAPGGMPSGAPGEEPPMGAEGEEEEAGAPADVGAVGREKRESIDYSRRLGMLLASKKK